MKNKTIRNIIVPILIVIIIRVIMVPIWGNMMNYPDFKWKLVLTILVSMLGSGFIILLNTTNKDIER